MMVLSSWTALPSMPYAYSDDLEDTIHPRRIPKSSWLVSGPLFLLFFFVSLFRPLCNPKKKKVMSMAVRNGIVCLDVFKSLPTALD